MSMKLRREICFPFLPTNSLGIQNNNGPDQFFRAASFHSTAFTHRLTEIYEFESYKKLDALLVTYRIEKKDSNVHLLLSHGANKYAPSVNLLTRR